MNKEADKAKVEQCLRQLREAWNGSRGTVLGLRLWRYDRGCWRKREDFLFATDATVTAKSASSFCTLLNLKARTFYVGLAADYVPLIIFMY